MIRKFIHGAAVLALTTVPALSQDYPDRDINGIIQWGVGGATDTVSRALKPVADEVLGRSVVMNNRSGGSGVIGMRYAQAQRPDGYTLLFGAENPQIYKVLGLADADYSDFYPVNLPARGVVVIAVPMDAPYQSLQDLLDAVQAQPGKLRMGTMGPGSLSHVVETMISSAAEFDVTAVPFDGEGPGFTAMLGGAVDFIPTSLSVAKPMLEAGRARALAVVESDAIAQLSDVPPITDTLPELERFLPWGPFYGVFVARDAPEEARDKLVEAFAAATDSQDFRRLMENRGNLMMNISGDEAEAFLHNWQSVSSWLLFDAGVAQKSPEEFGIPKP
ncbi:Tripartite-type tricarboxylate transporter, receptor component TctC [Paracoccus alcaliphilus]|uniref:Tripartite-type tricarboxylate transporter, receptor component TctC n=1 Tax=Paracoccus alcaliphilus TaxID=34002 RepID=A0A1H8F5I5_9RHOB|nr:tripartite tricarboxylate transporter substrate binding protein [Paracoccus alcaliphilus]WCR20376.1 tripartite tricarboxylate transporter substrate binding protein [Paracoccus alcaliphilus]SEN26407.1 Tripartite-type tricarboxylate transporter, receptor component TctC [Paracoccus alcaliphilus]